MFGKHLHLRVRKNHRRVPPPKNVMVEINSACVNSKPAKSITAFTRIFSMKNRSAPLNMQYRANNVPGVLKRFRTDQSTQKIPVAMRVS